MVTLKPSALAVGMLLTCCCTANWTCPDCMAWSVVVGLVITRMTTFFQWIAFGFQ